MISLSKLPHTGTTIFTVMSALANEVGAINLSQGFPDYDCAPQLIDLVSQAMKDGHNQYAPMPGLLPLREQIAYKTEKLHGAVLTPILKLPSPPEVRKPFLQLFVQPYTPMMRSSCLSLLMIAMRRLLN
jgi:hypothetical protein